MCKELSVLKWEIDKLSLQRSSLLHPAKALRDTTNAKIDEANNGIHFKETPQNLILNQTTSVKKQVGKFEKNATQCEVKPTLPDIQKNNIVTVNKIE